MSQTVNEVVFFIVFLRN